MYTDFTYAINIINKQYGMLNGKVLMGFKNIFTNPANKEKNGVEAF